MEPLTLVIPIQEEQILAEGAISRRNSDQSAFEKDLESFHERHSENKEKAAIQYKVSGENEKDYNNNKKDKDGKENSPKRYKERPPNHKIDPNGPKDRFNFSLIMFFVLGIIHSLPLTFFNMANEYWMYKFRDPTSNSTDANDRTWLQANFHSIQHMISSWPSTAIQFVLTFVGHKIKAKHRVFFTLTAHTLVFLFQTALVDINTDDWQVVFFGLTILAMTVLQCSLSLGSIGNMVVVSMFPDQYLKSYLVGEGVASLFTAIMRLVTIFMTPTVIAGAFLYFITGSVIMVVSTLLFYVNTNTPFFKYYTRSMKVLTKKRIPRIPEFIDILRYMWPILLLKILPSFIPHAPVANLTVSEFHGTDSVWGNKYFVTCMSYMLPAVCGIISRTVFYRFEINPTMPMLFLMVFGKEAIFAPLMFFVNEKPRHHLPVLFPHDWQYAILVATSSLSRAYINNTVTLKSIRIVPQEKLELSFLVSLIITKLVNAATSPIGLLSVRLL